MSHAARPGPGLVSGAQARAAARSHGEPAAPAVSYEGLVTRSIAFAFDAAVINITAIVVGTAVGLCLSVLELPGAVSDALIALGGVAYVAWSAGYFVVFWSTTGQTPGNRLLRIRVRRADVDAPLRPARAVLRLVGLTLAAIPLLAGFLPILVDDRRRGLQDMLAGSVVVAAPLADAAPVEQ